ncbi:hypothetical protein FOL75_26680 [Bacillus thuringiensis]|uniref:hypothetical protein n=1 Tax=Bacillus thuringiensis TaxID=1428 RepID=UPI002853FAC1|nr:hypothetical protein [Bacillus thuringiensis]MDR5025377.1 hypothetical protein [Bacillus thuringiensis]
MQIEEYIIYRNTGKQIKHIQQEYLLSETTALTLELGYQCTMKNISLDQALKFVENIIVMNPNKITTTTINPFNLATRIE